MKACLPLIVLTLASGCGHSREEAVVSGDLVAGPYISVKKPGSGGWQLQSQSDTAIAFVKGEAGNSFAATVTMFRLAPAASPAEFDRLIKEGATQDTDPDHPGRYELLEQTFVYSNERPYPCVRVQAVSIDKLAKGTKEPQFLELDGAYCRHPRDPGQVAAIMYSHRGPTRHPTLRAEAGDFIANAHLVGSN